MRRAVYEAITQSDMGIVNEKVKEDAKVTLKIAASVEDTTKNRLITIKIERPAFQRKLDLITLGCSEYLKIATSGATHCEDLLQIAAIIK